MNRYNVKGKESCEEFLSTKNLSISEAAESFSTKNEDQELSFVQEESGQMSLF